MRLVLYERGSRMIYLDAKDALSHAYRILARGESLRGTLADLPPGGDLTAQEWIVHATYIVKGMKYAAHGPYCRAVEARYSRITIDVQRAVDLLAPAIECPSRAFNAYVLHRWATGKNDRTDWVRWTGITGKGRRTLEGWQMEIRKRAEHYLDVGLSRTTDHFRDCGICARDVA
jgi:hypothetical protein